MRIHLSIITGIVAMIIAAVPLITAAEEKGKVTMEKVEYKGWKNNLKLAG